VSLPENSSVCSGSGINGYGDHADGGSRDGKHIHILTHIVHACTFMHTYSSTFTCTHTFTCTPSQGMRPG